ncbi:hypothetical protein [Actinomadura opuntiae]|uniref:hypothetical protein n=1 Tax=Actinomadura sp. OS1-43 TaxID=604315 RepID=UPI00255A8017|nr:hypothetical protein [Actinomadura sp. OS1-43]MDL4815450.1 hypothetical protein [Actinomadura sp. OS1-43]
MPNYMLLAVLGAAIVLFGFWLLTRPSCSQAGGNITKALPGASRRAGVHLSEGGVALVKLTDVPTGPDFKAPMYVKFWSSQS